MAENVQHLNPNAIVLPSRPQRPKVRRMKTRHAFQARTSLKQVKAAREAQHGVGLQVREPQNIQKSPMLTLVFSSRCFVV